MARRADAVEQAIDTLDAASGQVHGGIVADFAHWDAAAEAAASAMPDDGWQVLVHNAGGPPPGPLVDAEPEALQAGMNPHLMLGHALVRLVRPAMAAGGFGRIVNIVSTSIIMPIKGLGVSNTVRGAIGNWSRTLAAELGSEGITVNNVLPGFTDTARLAALLQKRAQAADTLVAAIADAIRSQIPVGRFARPQETAALVAFLCSDEAGSINGASIPVDGGRTGGAVGTAMHRIEHFINGAMTPAVDDDWIDLIEPATGIRIGTVAAGTAADMDKAVKAAQGAAPRWAATSPAERARVLRAMADGIETRMDDFARAESIDTGKPITLALAVDIPRAIANLRWFADAAVDFLDRSSTDELFQTDRASFAVTHQPVGVIGAISPWNLPLYLLTWKLAPALAMGNAVVAKPSELTPTTAAMLCAVAQEAGLPPGVLNCVHGTGVDAGAALVEHPMVQAVTFTGGTQTGRLVNAACAAGTTFKKVSLELGGKNATVIFADADMDAAIDTAAAAAFANQGQICLCGERLLVEASILDRVLEGVVEKARSLRIGDPLEPSTEFGSLISVEHRAKVAEAVKAAVADGGQLCCGGRPPCDLPPRVSSGAFYEPTVLTGLDMDTDFNRNEVFGPIVSLMPFEDEAEAIAMVNATDYGLSASVCTTDDARAQRMAQGIDVGTLWVNCWLVRDFRVPFGGMKHSGLGREGGDDALRFCSESKTVCTSRGPTTGTEGAIPLSVPSMRADT